jgi:hypothetical protein
MPIKILVEACEKASHIYFLHVTLISISSSLPSDSPLLQNYMTKETGVTRLRTSKATSVRPFTGGIQDDSKENNLKPQKKNALFPQTHNA